MVRLRCFSTDEVVSGVDLYLSKQIINDEYSDLIRTSIVMCVVAGDFVTIESRLSQFYTYHTLQLTSSPLSLHMYGTYFTHIPYRNYLVGPVPMPASDSKSPSDTNVM